MAPLGFFKGGLGPPLDLSRGANAPPCICQGGANAPPWIFQGGAFSFQGGAMPPLGGLCRTMILIEEVMSPSPSLCSHHKNV